MKRKFFLTLLMVTAMLSTYADDQLSYYFNDTDRTCKVVGYSGESKDVVIPSKVEKDGVEYTVTTIGYLAFYEEGLTSVTLPESLTEIGKEAFRHNSLTSVTLPESLTVIGEYAFQSNSLTSVTLPESLTVIGEYAFADNNLNYVYYNAINAACTRSFGMTGKLILGPKVKVAPEISATNLEFWQGIESMKNLVSRGFINITVHLTDIDEWAMSTPDGYGNLIERRPGSTYPDVTFDYNNQSIKNLTLGSKVEKIAPYAFARFTEIQSVTFPEYLTEIGDGAFRETSLSTIQLPARTIKVGDYAFSDCKNLEEAILPSTITELGKGVFSGCSALYSVSIPESISKLEDNLFYGCSDLEDIILPENITSIGESAFEDCSKLKIPTFPKGLENIGARAYYNNTFDEGELKFDQSLRVIGDWAFAHYYEYHIYNPQTGNLTVKFSEGLEAIGSGAFSCSNVGKILLPNTLTQIGSGAFSWTRLTDIKIPDGVTVINSGTFSDCSLRSVVLPDKLEEIGEQAFYDCPLTQIQLPASLKAIGRKAFYNSNTIYPDIISCNIPDRVVSMGENIFRAIKYLTIGTGITSIDGPIAENVSILEMKSSTPPALGVDRLGFTPYLVIVPEGAGDLYTGNNRWKDYNISARNSHKASVYISEPGTLATEIRIQTGYLPAQVTNLSVEGTLNEDDFAVMRSNMAACYSFDLSKITNTEIPEKAFIYKSIILELKLSDNTETIGAYAFYDCYLMHINSIPSKLKSIGDGAFENCQSLDNHFTFPATLESVGQESFKGCLSLSGIDFSSCPDAEIGSEAFSGCRNMNSAVLPENLKEISKNLFYNAGITSITIPDGVERINDGSFYGTQNLSNVHFPNSLVSIGADAFEWSGIESADLPASLKSIDRGAFGASSLVFADVKEGITELPSGVFSGCRNLMVVNLPSTLSSLGHSALGSSSLSVISVASELPPSTPNGSPFGDLDSVDMNNCALTIPKPSYSKYLSAEYWGGFVDIRNWIDVTIQDSEDGGITSEDRNSDIDVTYIEEEDYQQMLEDENSDIESYNDHRKRALRVMRRAGVIGNSRGYGRLYNGARLFASDNSRVRVFLNIPQEVKTKVLYNGADITSQIDTETMSFVTPELTSISSLQILTDGVSSSVDKTIYDEENAPIYTITGILVGYGKESLERLPDGVYIFCGRKILK
ncbi:MAG: leucine-rich repeat domain-containing protein [Bacteroidales bacterium]|nr:leucine-rich repeat domain-containing protein [Bacteroidales bacterium]